MLVNEKFRDNHLEECDNKQVRRRRNEIEFSSLSKKAKSIVQNSTKVANGILNLFFC